MSNLELNNFDGPRLDGLVFCAQVYDFFEQIRRADGGISELRMRSTERAERVLEELLPICRHVQAMLSGNQPAAPLGSSATERACGPS